MFHVAFTTPVNTNGAGRQESPHLTKEDLWAGCLRLAYHPEDFTSFVAGCKVHLDTGTKVTRTLFFKDGPQTPPGGKIEQEILLLKNLRIECVTVPSGNKVTTSISSHPSTGDLYLSFTYEIPYGNVEEGSREGEAMKNKYTESGRGHLVSGVETMREMKLKGVI